MTHEVVKELRRSQPVSAEGGPGDLLRRAREKLHLSVSDIAGHLRLRLHIIEAIEHDDYTALPSAVFAQGYLRSYASLVGLESEEVMQAYRQLGLPPESHCIVPEDHQKMSADENNRQLMKGVTYLVIVALIALIGIWGYNQAENINTHLDAGAINATAHPAATKQAAASAGTSAPVPLPVPEQKTPEKNAATPAASVSAAEPASNTAIHPATSGAAANPAVKSSVDVGAKAIAQAKKQSEEEVESSAATDNATEEVEEEKPAEKTRKSAIVEE